MRGWKAFQFPARSKPMNESKGTQAWSELNLGLFSVYKCGKDI